MVILIKTMDNHSDIDVRDFVGRFAIWIAKNRSIEEAKAYAESVLKDNPEVLKLVLIDISNATNSSH